jgi:uncharacterized membrane protein
MSAVEATVEVGAPVSTAYNQWTQLESLLKLAVVAGVAHAPGPGSFP